MSLKTFLKSKINRIITALTVVAVAGAGISVGVIAILMVTNPMVPPFILTRVRVRSAFPNIASKVERLKAPLSTLKLLI
jgi:hypothetical protein